MLISWNEEKFTSTKLLSINNDVKLPIYHKKNYQEQWKSEHVNKMSKISENLKV